MTGGSFPYPAVDEREVVNFYYNAVGDGQRSQIVTGKIGQWRLDFHFRRDKITIVIIFFHCFDYLLFVIKDVPQEVFSFGNVQSVEVDFESKRNNLAFSQPSYQYLSYELIRACYGGIDRQVETYCERTSRPIAVIEDFQSFYCKQRTVYGQGSAVITGQVGIAHDRKSDGGIGIETVVVIVFIRFGYFTVFVDDKSYKVSAGFDGLRTYICGEIYGNGITCRKCIHIYFADQYIKRSKVDIRG